MKWLNTVRFVGLNPAMVLACMRIEEIYAPFAEDCWITSANDSKHKVKSKHYVGCALDFRTKNLPVAQRTKVAESIRQALGPEFVVLLEDSGKPNEHLHVQYNGVEAAPK